MTLYSFALRIKEITKLENELQQTRNIRVAARIHDRKADLDILVNSIIRTYHVPQQTDGQECYVDVDQYGL